MHKIYELKEQVMNDLESFDYNRGNADQLYKLSSIAKNLCKVIAAAEEEQGGGSYRGGSYGEGGSYRGSYEGGSYARGRRNAPRDSMGRYSGDGGYSRDSGMIDQLYNLMDQTQDINMRNNIERMIEMAQKSGK